MDAVQAAWSPEKRVAEQLVAELAALWEAPMQAMARAGRAFAGLEAVLGGDAFSLQVRKPVRGASCSGTAKNPALLLQRVRLCSALR